MNIIHLALDFLLHLDKHLAGLISSVGIWTYVILFLIIFSETGLVILPFLPGDSLLFIAGTLASSNALSILPLYIVFLAAAILGDTVNYWIGHHFGERIYQAKKLPFINKDHLDKAHHFYQKHGGKTIILARFIPIIRTFAPFVAGVGKMEYGKFISFNFIGGFVWVTLFTFAGYFFGNIPFVKHNYEKVLVIIIFLSLLPPLIEYVKHKMEQKSSSNTPQK
jgi:membrane-associated protein